MRAMTQKQGEVIALLCEGMTNGQAAERLGVSQAAVEIRLLTLYRNMRRSGRKGSLRTQAMRDWLMTNRSPL